MMRRWSRHGLLSSQMCHPDVPTQLGLICFRKANLQTTGGALGLYSEGHLLWDPTLPCTFSRAKSIRKVTAA